MAANFIASLGVEAFKFLLVAKVITQQRNVHRNYTVKFDDVATIGKNADSNQKWNFVLTKNAVFKNLVKDCVHSHQKFRCVLDHADSL